jgi:voltage-gated potassium channel
MPSAGALRSACIRFVQVLYPAGLSTFWKEIKMLRAKKLHEAGNSGLLAMVFITIFVVPMLPIAWHRITFNFLFTFIFLISILAVSTQKKYIIVGAVILILVSWIADIVGLNILSRISTALTIFFFMMIVIKLIIQVAGTKHVTIQVILEAINSYLLLGLVFTLLTALLMAIDPGAISFEAGIVNNPEVSHLSEFLYYSFVTMSTLGYGDVVPVSSVAKSIAILTSVSGQIYVAVILALLVGKFASTE